MTTTQPLAASSPKHASTSSLNLAQQTPPMDPRMKRLLVAIEHETSRVVSFDIFDTLIVRKYWDPADLFELMGRREDVRTLFGSRNFAALRIGAERALRLRIEAERQDPSLAQIYAELRQLADLTAATAEQLMQIEIKTELAAVAPRKALRQCFEAAVAAGKTVVLCTDMYLPRDCIERMLAACGYNTRVRIYLSCEIGLTKKHGTIFAHVARDLGVQPADILHIGDNKHSDIDMAARAGVRALHTTMVREAILQSKDRGLIGLTPDFRRSSELPDFATRSSMKLISERLFNHRFDGAFGDGQSNENQENFGYCALGPFILSLALWMRRQAIDRQLDTVAFLARDGFLPQQAMALLDGVLGPRFADSYLPISRRMIFPWLLHQPGGFDSIANIGYRPSLTVESFLKERFGEAGKALFCDLLGSRADQILCHSMYDRQRFVAETLRDNLPELKRRTLDAKERTESFYREALGQGERIALFDVGRKGTFQKALSDILQKDIHGFYVVASYQIHANAPDRAFNAYLGLMDSRVRAKSPDTILYEALLSEQAGGFIGLAEDGRLQRDPVVSNPAGEVGFAAIHRGALAYVADAVAHFGSDVTLLEQEPYYASYGLEHWEKSPACRAVLDSLPHEDSISDGEPRPLGAIFAENSAPIDARLSFPVNSGRRRIAIYCPSMTQIRGGAERVTALIANHLASQGDEVLILSSGKATNAIQPVYPLDQRIFVRNVDVRDVSDIRKVLANFAPDLGAILASGPAVARVSEAFLQEEIRYAVSERAEPALSKATYWGGYPDADYTETHAAADLIALQFESFATAFPAGLQHKIMTIPNPIFTRPDQCRLRPRRIICAARIWFQQKRQNLLLEAFAALAGKYPDWRLDFYGHPYNDDAALLQAQVEALGLTAQVGIHPAINTILEEFENAALFVLPSAFEGFPNALGEALACGTPAIGFAGCPGVNQLILDGQNGLLVADADLPVEAGEPRIERLTAALEKMMADPEFRDSCAAGAKASVAGYEAETVLAQWSALFVRLAALPPADEPRASLAKVIARRSLTAVNTSALEAAFSKELETAVARIRRAITSLGPIRRLQVGFYRGLGEPADRILALSQHFGRNLALPIPEDFDEDGYLRRNPDVAASVLAGQLQSGYLHYLRYGFQEGRPRDI